MTIPLQTLITEFNKSYAGADLKDLITANAEIDKLIRTMSGVASIAIIAASASGTPKKRNITSKLTRSPLSGEREPDKAFKTWCDLGGLICSLWRRDNIFARDARQIVGPSYRAGKCVITVINHAKMHPKAYAANKGTGAYYKFGI